MSISEIQDMFDVRAEAVYKLQKCSTTIDHIKYRIRAKASERLITDKIQSGGREMLKSAFEYIPWKMLSK